MTISPRPEPGASVSHRANRFGAVFLDTRLSGVCLVVALLFMWEASARLGIVQSANWPPFSKVVEALFANLMTGELLKVIGATLSVAFRGLALGCSLGVLTGFAIALWRPIRLTIEPTIDILRTVPPTAVIPPLIFIFGLGDSLKIFAVSSAVFFPMALNTMSGVASIEPTYIQAARTFGLSSTRILRKIWLPASLPFIMAGLRTSLGLALIVTVVTEMISGNGGVGFYLFQMQYALRTSEMYAAIVLLTIVAYGLNRVFILWEAHVIHWARVREAAWSRK